MNHTHSSDLLQRYGTEAQASKQAVVRQRLSLIGALNLPARDYWCVMLVSFFLSFVLCEELQKQNKNTEKYRQEIGKRRRKQQ